ncbi:FAD-binding oxidoreductase [Streptomyces sp. NBRC 110028]|uniref:FAD-binding protein n=1 Tax=Streptomyces sp. NBRC 110028 TaxID=1621260 RepID=UPI0007C68CC1|nr:FAD-binding oxidoreductase [Streptomyces sp. NBRC 110028]
MRTDDWTTPLAWNRVHRYRQRVLEVPRGLSAVPETSGSVLPRGFGHSYGDSCLNADNTLLDTRGLNRILSFDPETGVLHCEAGVTIGAVQRYATPYGWRLAVSPSTGLASVAGSVAHDVHGRNHIFAGSFGHHLLEIELMRSDGRRRLCGPGADDQLFRATVGGMGLTGLITTVKLQLRPVKSSFINVETHCHTDLSQLMAHIDATADTHEYATAWLDLVGRQTFRGVLEIGNEGPGERSFPQDRFQPRVPFDLPRLCVNRPHMHAFNLAYFRLCGRKKPGRVSYQKYLYQMDSLGDWNRLLGRKGFYQYHFLIPAAAVPDGLPRLLDAVRSSDNVAVLAILKRYGPSAAPGMMSFPVHGVGGAFDFVNRGERTLRLFHELDELMIELGGRVYLAKDSALDPGTFKLMYPQWTAFREFVDPRFSSSLWRRVTGEEP